MPLSKDDFAEVLRRCGYTLTPESEGYLVTGKGVFGIVAPSGTWFGAPPVLGEWCACFDHADCYDKPRKCPVRLGAVDSEDPTFIDRIVAALEKLGAPEGFKVSNEFGYDPHNNQFWPNPT